jgi:hypothetical protein
MSRIAALLIILGLAACGMRGPLERPTGPAPEPLFGNPKPAPPASPAAKTGPDVSTTPTAKPFSLKNGVLHAESVALPAIAEKFGTPAYVYSALR